MPNQSPAVAAGIVLYELLVGALPWDSSAWGTRNAAEFSAAAALLASRLADFTTGTNLHIGVGEARFLN